MPRFAPVSSGVLILREVPVTVPPNSEFISSGGVLVFNGPLLSGVSPTTLPIATTTSVTITGSGLSGVTGIFFLTASGALDDLITVSNISVAPDGASLTADVLVGGSAAPGNRFIIVRTTRGNSLVTVPNGNRVLIQ
jgi:hypothetical protein